MRLELPAGTVEKLRARIRLDRDTTDPTVATVAYQLVDPAVSLTAASPGWTAMSWVAGGPPYYTEALVTGVAGAFRFWVRITLASEVVLRRVGIVEFV
jgi:hypothetical protein